MWERVRGKWEWQTEKGEIVPNDLHSSPTLRTWAPSQAINPLVISHQVWACVYVFVFVFYPEGVKLQATEESVSVTKCKVVFSQWKPMVSHRQHQYSTHANVWGVNSWRGEEEKRRLGDIELQVSRCLCPFSSIYSQVHLWNDASYGSIPVFPQPEGPHQKTLGWHIIPSIKRWSSNGLKE